MANISGNEPADYAYMAERLAAARVDFLEVNISCPNVRNGCLAFGVEPATAAAVTRAVKDHAGSVPVVVKLSPNVTDITVIAQAVEAAESGWHPCSSIPLLGMAIDAERRCLCSAT